VNTRSKKIAAALLALTVCGGWNPFLKQNADVKEGNEAYADGKFDPALGSYDAALKTTRDSVEAHFNRGDALYKQGKFDDAAREYVRAASGGDKGFKSRTLHNLGNTFAKGGKTQEAIDAYIKSLMLDPKNQDTKYNLELLLRQDQEPQLQPQNQQNQQEQLDKMKEQEKNVQMNKQQLKEFKAKEVEKDW